MSRFRQEVIGDSLLICGDCKEALSTLDHFDAVLTDPPYGIAHKWVGGGKFGWGNANAYKEMRNGWDTAPPDAVLFDQLLEISTEQIIWGGNHFPLRSSRGWLVWNKPERNFTLAEAELAWTSRDAVIRVFDCPRSESDRTHPTQKPLKLMQWCLGFLPNAETVLDCFMGSGTTGVACVNLGRKFTGIEIHEPYFDIACRRIEQAYKQPRLFAEPIAKPIQEPLDL